MIAGQPPAVVWELHEAYKSEAYSLALVWLDVTGGALSLRQAFHRTLTHQARVSSARHQPIIILSSARHQPIIIPSSARHRPVIIP